MKKQLKKKTVINEKDYDKFELKITKDSEMPFVLKCKTCGAMHPAHITMENKDE